MVPQPSDRAVPVQVETDRDVAHVAIVFEAGAGAVALESVAEIGAQKFWNFTWSAVVPGDYRFRADVRRESAGPVVASAGRDVTVEIGPAVPVVQDDDMDDLLRDRRTRRAERTARAMSESRFSSSGGDGK